MSELPGENWYTLGADLGEQIGIRRDGRKRAVDVVGQRDVGDRRDDRRGDIEVVSGGFQLLPRARGESAVALVDGLADRLDGTERPDQRGRRLVSHARDPGQAVAGVTAQRRVVGVGAPGDLVPGRDRGLVHDVQLGQAARGVDDPHRLGVVDQLEQVAVAGDDLDRPC